MYSSSSSSSSSSPPAKSVRTGRGRRQLKRSAKNNLARVYAPVKAEKFKGYETIEDFAYDAFFAGFRPLRFDASTSNFNPFEKMTTSNDLIEDAVRDSDRDTVDALQYPLGAYSATGIVLDSAIQALPSAVLDQMRGNKPPAAPGCRPSIDTVISDAAMQIVEGKFDTYGEIQDTDAMDVLGEADLFTTLRCVALVDADFQGIKKLKQRLDEKGIHKLNLVELSDNLIEGSLESALEEPSRQLAEESSMQLTSVVRKRRLKMKKHKLRKRRRAERASKRKLGG
ncbi:uncharacterized protein V1518DRAFT_426012 [Limtongia smithiae]|uniref:uncharacterized protein n=1 Tax=Limtongia smithiae TaxID=1125753 RepID=UPI0034CD2B92